MSLKKLYDIIGDTSLGDKIPVGPTLKEMHITPKAVSAIDKWARERVKCGVLATYIPELKNVDRDLTAIAIGDMHCEEVVAGDGAKAIASAQSVIKPFLYLYALEQGAQPEEISDIEPTALPFNADRILNPELQPKKAGHPLNNAGAISSAGEIRDFGEFLKFMQKLTRNPKLSVLTKIYSSEMKTNSNNRAIAQRLVAGGRFANVGEGEVALANYTKACSIGMTVRDALHACLVLTSGGMDIASGKRLVKKDNVVRVMAAMNTFGMYEQTAEFALLVAGSRANTCKSGVGGIIININPGVGAFVTYSPLLNSAGNSVYGSYAMIPLNNLLAAPGALRLSLKETEKALDEYDERENNRIHEAIARLISNGEKPSAYRMEKK